ncbi:diguanylate cyclase (GGDEF)-like protein [Sinobaca qinghaiensis]|uniref:Diguanylate cyclase (GGDEF)-like protein n=1 Tax=Sinobaca qinghaiensis TaxID=342944 RepID=A0A419V028_9BACL|nr:diguanylate cyclase [Sinobaca qinghaiensis]RKD71269.1 diguanylate cyclase (GGDEF)-like protein [Sinobaca qinghaiensis]
MENYQALFLKKTRQTWQSFQMRQTIENDEVYRWLHTLKGTGGTLGLSELSAVSEEKMENLDDNEDARWNIDQLSDFLAPLIRTFQEEESLNTTPVSVKEEAGQGPLLLLVDDDVDFANYIKDQFQEEGYLVLLAPDKKKALEMYHHYHPDCLLVDIFVPDKQDGFYLLNTVSQIAEALVTPVIAITSDTTPETKYEAYRQGASFVLHKPFDIRELKHILSNQLTRKERIQNAITIDELTGVFNRKILDTASDRFFGAYRREGAEFSGVLLDLDHFKAVNDTFGHDRGDKVLKQFAAFLDGQKRPQDMLIRLGGEEFLMVLPNTGKDQAIKAAERWCKNYSEMMLDSLDDMVLTFSAGVSTVTPNTESLDVLLNECDQALAIAKEEGRNRIRTYQRGNEIIRKMPMNIIIVDDDEVMGGFLLNRFQRLELPKYDINVSYYREGESFLKDDWYKRSQKFFIILDVTMPRMNGFEVLTNLRKNFPASDIVVLMLTGSKAEKDVIRALELGADDYLVKPFKVEELLARSRRFIQRIL